MCCKWLQVSLSKCKGMGVMQALVFYGVHINNKQEKMSIIKNKENLIKNILKLL